jgi:hypothetical protein
MLEQWMGWIEISTDAEVWCGTDVYPPHIHRPVWIQHPWYLLRFPGVIFDQGCSLLRAQQALQAAQSEGPVRIGAIVERDGAILLQQDPDSGAVRLPTSARLGSADDPGSLMGRLAALGVEARLPFLFAVYEGGDTHCVYYRGEVPGGTGSGTTDRQGFIAFDDIPWQRIADPALRSMLERYVHERESDTFGLYAGNAAAGAVHPFN